LVGHDDGELEIVAVKHMPLAEFASPLFVFLFGLLMAGLVFWIGETDGMMTFAWWVLVFSFFTPALLIAMRMMEIRKELSYGEIILQISSDNSFSLPRDNIHYRAGTKATIELTVDYLPGDYIRPHGGGVRACGQEVNLFVENGDGDRLHGLVRLGEYPELKEAAKILSQRMGWEIDEFVESGWPLDKSKILPRHCPFRKFDQKT